jgi:hypothetical protein
MSYIGNPPVNGVFRKLDTIAASFNGSTTSFNLTSGGAPVIPGLTTNLIISLGGIIQEPNTAYTVNGSVISFTAAPPAGTSFWGIQLGDVGLAQTPNQNAMTTQVFTATAGQTTFTVNGGYTPGQLEVFRNGVMLVGGVDYTATNGTTFVLTNAATVGDTLVSVAYVSFIVANAVAKSGDTMTGNLNITGGTLQVGGNQAVNGPAFYAASTAVQTGLSFATYIKVIFGSEEFDTNSNYDPVTSRFTPTVPGYYQVNWHAQGNGTVNTAWMFTSLYKNGVITNRYGSSINGGSTVYSSGMSGGSSIVYMNGSTDYLEVYGYLTGSGTGTFSTVAAFSASMIRGA